MFIITIEDIIWLSAFAVALISILVGLIINFAGYIYGYLYNKFKKKDSRK